MGADKAYDDDAFVADCRRACIIPHVTQRVRFSAIDGRTARHKDNALSRKHRKRIEELSGWSKTFGGAEEIAASTHGMLEVAGFQK